MKQKCQTHISVKQHKNAATHLRHQYHMSELSNGVYNFVLAQGAQKLSARVKM